MARKPKLDMVLAESADAAYQALKEITDLNQVGDHLGVAVEGERLVTHRFVSLKDGYRGWTWFVTLARVPRAKAKDATVCELGIIPGEGALLAPAWVPWAERLAQEEIDAAQSGTEEAPLTDQTPTVEQPDSQSAQQQNPANGETEQQDSADEAELQEDDQEPARRPVRRRRTAQRTAARRRAAQRNRSRNS